MSTRFASSSFRTLLTRVPRTPTQVRDGINPFVADSTAILARVIQHPLAQDLIQQAPARFQAPPDGTASIMYSGAVRDRMIGAT
jgi:hypothetical protein